MSAAAIEGLYLAALRLHREGNLAAAERGYRKLLAVLPTHADSLHLLGVIALQAHQPEAALALIQRAIEQNPRDPFYHCNLGNVLLELNRREEAEQHYRRALELNPEHPEALENLAGLLRLRKRPEESIDFYQRLAALRPEDAETQMKLGNAFHAAGNIAEAAAAYQRTVELRPDYAEALVNWGITLQALGKPAEAEARYQRAIAQSEENAAAHTNQGLLQLQRGDFAVGWRNYEWRWRMAHFESPIRFFSQPQWRGEALEGKRILLHCEQGLGDCLQFLRYVPMVQAAGGKVILELPAGLKRIAALLPGLEAVAAFGEELPAFDWQCPLMSLPLAFQTASETIPAQVPYIRTPAEAKARAAALPWPAAGLRVGLVWSGSTTHVKNHLRSLALRQLEPLFGLPNVHFYSLQIGAAAGQLEAFPAITDLAPATSDMADTAAQIEQLDLVISVDTSVAHLAGALGRPVWILLSTDPDWRWMLEREDSPWYPTARLFRQREPGNWNEVIERVAREVKKQG